MLLIIYKQAAVVCVMCSINTHIFVTSDMCISFRQSLENPPSNSAELWPRSTSQGMDFKSFASEAELQRLSMKRLWRQQQLARCFIFHRFMGKWKRERSFFKKHTHLSYSLPEGTQGTLKEAAWRACGLIRPKLSVLAFAICSWTCKCFFSTVKTGWSWATLSGRNICTYVFYTLNVDYSEAVHCDIKVLKKQQSNVNLIKMWFKKSECTFPHGNLLVRFKMNV